VRAGWFLALVAMTAGPATAERDNPLIGQWTRETTGSAEGVSGDPRQRLTFTPEMMIVGISDGLELRRYEFGDGRIRARTRIGTTFTFQMFGPDRMCMVGGAADERAIHAPGLPMRRCYVRGAKPFDASLI
jgi:hypothetical protein